MYVNAMAVALVKKTYSIIPETTELNNFYCYLFLF